MLDTPQKVKFRRLDQSTKEDHDILQPYLAEENKHIADHILGLFKGQAGNPGPLLVDMFEHGLQCATHAERDGADEETIVCALLHDLGHYIAPHAHGAFIAEILKPYISAVNFNVLRNHTAFQGHYFFHHIGMDRNLRDKWKGEDWYDAAVTFTGKWDQAAFDPDFKPEPLEHFEPMVRRIFARQPFLYSNAMKD